MIQNKIEYHLKLSQISYFLLIILIPIWWFIYPTTQYPYLVFSIWWIPLLFPLKGIYLKKNYTMAWTIFIFIIPFCHALMSLISNPSEIRWALTELMLVSSYYFHIFKASKFQRSLEQRDLNK